jgi:endonuclease/exonuclease/phosphatase (EEP) superfamily protein YafD
MGKMNDKSIENEPEWGKISFGAVERAALIEALQNDADEILLTRTNAEQLNALVALKNAHSHFAEEMELSGGLDAQLRDECYEQCAEAEAICWAQGCKLALILEAVELGRSSANVVREVE